MVLIRSYALRGLRNYIIFPYIASKLLFIGSSLAERGCLVNLVLKPWFKGFCKPVLLMPGPRFVENNVCRKKAIMCSLWDGVGRFENN